MRPRCTFRWRTFLGISMVSVLVPVELRRLVVLTRAALDLLFLGEETLELGVGLLHEGRRFAELPVPARGLVHGSRLVGRTAATAAGTDHATPGARGFADGHRGLLGDLVLGRGLVGEDLALVDPDLHADAPERGARLGLAVVDVGPQRVQRHPTLAVPLLATHLGAAEATTALHADAESAGLHRGLHRALHRPAKADPAGELVGDTLRDQRGVELGLLDLLDVELDLRVARDLEQPGPQAVGLGAAATDDDAGARGVEVDAQAVTRPLDLDPADHRALELGAQVVADLPVLDQQVLVLLVLGEPPRLPVGGDAESEPVGVDLLAHYFAPFDESPDSSVASSSASASAVATGGSSASSSASVPASSPAASASASVSSASPSPWV